VCNVTAGAEAEYDQTIFEIAKGEREVKVTITPASGGASTSAVKFQVVRKGG